MFQVQDHSICSYDGYRDLQAANISNEIRGRILNENPGAKLGSSFVYGEIGGKLSKTDKDDVHYYLRLFSVGAAVAVLSVFTVLRTVFKDRESNIRILSNIGMSRKKRAALCYMNFTHTGK